jgi:cell division septation protein DedD
MFNINEILKELVQLHDCVIFPNLGGFVAQYSPAKLELHKTVISPPSKQILFNKNLVNNDGLLVNAVAQNKNITYQESLEFLGSLLIEINQNLDDQNQFEFDGIGVLFKVQGVLNFKQNSNNLLTLSYGLRPINIEEFNSENKITKVVNLDPSRISNSQIKNWAIAASVIIIVFYSAWIPFKTQLFKKNGDFNYSDLNPFTFQKQKSDKQDLSPLSVISPKKIITQPKNKVNTTVNSIIIKSPENISPVKNSKSYEVVIGSFGNELNANSLISKLNLKGINARKLDVENELFRVSAGKFSNKKNANRLQKAINKSHKISSWILIK